MYVRIWSLCGLCKTVEVIHVPDIILGRYPVKTDKCTEKHVVSVSIQNSRLLETASDINENSKQITWSIEGIDMMEK